MESPNFIDYVCVHAKAGDGGAGMVHFRREKYVSRGGADGGDGGRGGHVGMVADAGCWTLMHLRHRRHLFAGAGVAGGRARRTGADGADLWVPVPLGTMARDEKGHLMGEVLRAGDKVLLLDGGRGGRGNAHFVRATRQAPEYAQPGEKGQGARLSLELKVLADVGLVGLPNAGKSSLLGRLSEASPKVAPYAFTTLQPVLGVVALSGGRSFVMADMPGLIAGASQGRGLGFRFLRHIERNAWLLYVISAEGGAQAVAQTYAQLRAELAAYEETLAQKSHVVAVSKSDLVSSSVYAQIAAALPEDVAVYFTSSVTEEGLVGLKEGLYGLFAKLMR